ncbi:MAG: DUF4249 domain-containing protein [Bacteroidetes bacterium]|nr:MAG: DUF4249 domain-containing protein [Bacteroidota bacterium]REK00029.1 MAG: DUF4249 domain-containing protein [Bacteroidota bacterium]REK35790.1 MAG: DUF4249 domain-containing protein [Bacteroidota bacterium]REK49337.1 MAG: DUF4249 domain-containing protein [Bacteroidota bacterium]
MMERKLYRVMAFILIIIGFSACEKNVTVEIPESEPKIVVEGYVIAGEKPYVILSRTLPFFGTVNINSVVNQTITGALVTVSDGIITDTLEQFPGIGLYISDLITGESGKTYTLRVEAEGKVLSSSTFLPQPVALDSVWWKVNGNRDSLGFAWAHLTDPDTLGNYYRWFAQRINRYTFGLEEGKIKDSIFIAPNGSVFEDKFINGKSFDFAYQRGQVPNSNKADDFNDEKFFFKIGDTIVVRFCTIDRSHFDFWRTVETQVGSNGNPFASVAPVSSNIEGGLGIWGGYACTFDTIIAR